LKLRGGGRFRQAPNRKIPRQARVGARCRLPPICARDRSPRIDGMTIPEAAFAVSEPCASAACLGHDRTDRGGTEWRLVASAARRNVRKITQRSRPGGNILHGFQSRMMPSRHTPTR
jgi:hypothetical protein